jgi:hypothetical protein
MDRLRLAPPLAGHQHVSRFTRRLLRRRLSDAGFAVVRLGTFCTVAPFLSVLSWRAAERLARAEDAWNLPWNLFLAIAEKRPRERVPAISPSSSSYRGAELAARSARELAEFLPTLGISWEVVFVDDGEATWPVSKEGIRLRVISFPKNRGRERRCGRECSPRPGKRGFSPTSIFRSSLRASRMRCTCCATAVSTWCWAIAPAAIVVPAAPELGAPRGLADILGFRRHRS